MPYILQHVTLVTSLWHPSPSYQGVIGGSNINRDVYTRLYEEFSMTLLAYFKAHPDCIPQLEALVLKNRKRSAFHHEAYNGSA